MKIINKNSRSLLILLLIFSSCISNKIINEHKHHPSPTFIQLNEHFKLPPINYHPETWFHFNGNNISKEGITLDLEAIKYAGIQGIHLFSKNGQVLSWC